MKTKRKTVAKPGAKRVENLGEWKPSRMDGDAPKVNVTIPDGLRKPSWRFDVKSALLGVIACSLFLALLTSAMRYGAAS